MIVAAGAADTARKVLKRGGNAVDTVVAVAFTLAVTHADAGNLGGGGFATLWMDGKPYFIDYRETAPRAASATMYLDASGNVIPDSSTVGARAARVPGTVRGLWELHQRFGKLPWKVDLEPAIDNAEHGFLPDKGMADLRDDRQKQLGARTNFRRYFSAMRAGKTFRQPELAATLRRIAASGPGDFSVLGETALSESGTVTLNDLAHVVPGLTSIDQGPGTRAHNNNFAMRGLRTDAASGGAKSDSIAGQTVSSVSTYFGETPVFFAMPMQDVERVEVLRGPQGTLYGSGAQGGTIRLIPHRPQFDSFSGEVEGNVSNTEHSDQTGSEGSLILNIPLASKLALRAVAGVEHFAGYIDRVDLLQRGAGTWESAVPIPSVPGDLTSGPVLAPIRKDTNSGSQWFARGALRWQPLDAVDLQLDYLHEHTKSNDTQNTNELYHGGLVDLTAPDSLNAIGTGIYPNSAFQARGGGKYDSTGFALEPYDDTTNLVSLVGTIDVGLGSVTSSTSYSEVGTNTFADGTNYYILSGAGINFNSYFPYSNYPRLLVVQPSINNERAFTQELRFASNVGTRFDYVAGLFYQRQTTYTQARQNIPGISDYLTAIGQPNPTTYGDVPWLYQRHTRFEDKALFGEFTYHLTSQWSATAGLRLFKQNFDNATTTRLPLCGSVCASDLVDPTGLSAASASSDVKDHVIKLNTAYNFTPNHKVYVTYSEGFRRGGANAVPTAGTFASLDRFQTFAPDLAKNYEIGFKGTLAERVRYSADVFLINLTNFQFNSSSLSGLPITFNGPKARTKGIELEASASVTRDFTAGLGYSYTEATVSQTFDIQDYPPYALVPDFGGTGETKSVLGGPVKAGSRLPGVPKNVLTGSADYAIHLPWGTDWRVTAHIDGSYRSSAEGNITQSSLYYWKIPSSFMGNTRLTLDAGAQLSVAAFINNFTSNTAHTGSGGVNAVPNIFESFTTVRPRTYGLSTTYRF